MSGAGRDRLGPIRRLDEVDSTNNYLKARAHELPDGAAVVAERQTGGRGRRGRAWVIEPGKSLALSFLLHDFDPAGMGCLPLLAALGTRRGLERACGLSVGVKWSNDLVLDGRKLCGILCESRGRFAVVGIGVNVGESEAELARHGLVYASSLFVATRKIHDRMDIAREILAGCGEILALFAKNGFAGPLLDEYRRCCVTLNRTVRVLREGQEVEARAVDVGADGSLLVELGGERVPILAGEATIRSPNGYADLSP